MTGTPGSPVTAGTPDRTGSPAPSGAPDSATGNVGDLVRATAARTPDKPAFLFRGRALSWAELDARVDRCAAGLAGLGLAPGDRVALQVGNTPDFPTTWFGALRAGLVAVPVNTGYTRDEVRHVLSDVGAAALVTGRSGAAAARALLEELAGLRHVVLLEADDAPADEAGRSTTLEALLAADLEVPQPERGGEDLAAVLYTSGTSGRPRGAMLSHRALLANLEQCARIDPPVVAHDDVVLLVLPLFHVYGLGAALGAVAREGATGLLVERFDPVETLEEVRAAGVTSLVGAPPMYVAWSMLPDVGEALSSVRVALSGASALPAPVLRRFLEATGHHVFEGYGLTETAPVLTSTLMSEVAKAGSVGRPVPGVELRLVAEDGGDVDEGDPGEVVVRGANLFSGYWPDGADGPGADGWWPTGDVGVLDDDGDLVLVDRRREMIIVSGFNVYPREVEEVLLAHPDVAEAAVLGVPHPYTGESVKAVVVPRDGARLSAEDVVDFAAQRLARFKCPTAVEFATSLPHSATGKVSKGRLREDAPAG